MGWILLWIMPWCRITRSTCWPIVQCATTELRSPPVFPIPNVCICHIFILDIIAKSEYKIYVIGIDNATTCKLKSAHIQLISADAELTIWQKRRSLYTLWHASIYLKYCLKYLLKYSTMKWYYNATIASRSISLPTVRSREQVTSWWSTLFLSVW